MKRRAKAWAKTNDVPFQPMSAREREELEEQAGRAFVSDDRAVAYRRQKLLEGINPASGPGAEASAYVQAPLVWNVVVQKKKGRAA